jgi:cation diffusion facilitator CzcD-associated flavoprotein CzcO
MYMTAEHVDVLIIGAGLSGISAACHLERHNPGKQYAILEARHDMGGTWDLFRYPGIRSDSDMFTLGFGFRPWREAKAIADGPSILKYIRDTASEFGVDRHIRYGHKALSADWSHDEQRWTVEVERDGEPATLTCSFLFGCTGYYDYEKGFSPEFPGADRFKGQIVHPQRWTDDVEYDGKRVVVIGSGATAVTLVPAMAERAAHVTMLQRTPSYILALPGTDPIANGIRRVLPERLAHRVVRWKNVLLTMANYQLSRRRPKMMKKLITGLVKRQLPEGYDVKKHFTPPYNPWDQRLCLVPNGDLFRTIRRGHASVVTDTIETFTETGIRLTSGEEIDADLVVTATGLNLLALGGIELSVEGEPVKLPEKVAYKGLMLAGVPNFAIALGYTNASWTLKCELICEYVARLIHNMDEHGYAVATPREPDPSEPTQPFITDLTSGYVLRAIADFPRQGVEAPWVVHQNYIRDVQLMRRGRVDDGMDFERTRVREPQPA